jgi:hypothetical protein
VDISRCKFFGEKSKGYRDKGEKFVRSRKRKSKYSINGNRNQRVKLKQNWDIEKRPTVRSRITNFD